MQIVCKSMNSNMQGWHLFIGTAPLPNSTLKYRHLLAGFFLYVDIRDEKNFTCYVSLGQDTVKVIRAEPRENQDVPSMNCTLI